jgi:hypothetical protein
MLKQKRQQCTDYDHDYAYHGTHYFEVRFVSLLNELKLAYFVAMSADLVL